MTEPTINRWGQYLIENRAYQRATTLAGLMENRQNLERWKIRNVARGLIARNDILAAIAACPEDDKARADGLCEQALEAAAGSSGANLGTALHEMTARVDAGEEFAPPPPWDVDIKAYRDLIAAAGIGICPAWIEKTCVIPELGVAGTFDRVVEKNDRLFIADLKTGKDLSYGWAAIAIQLALYAHAEFIWDWDSKTRQVMPEVSRKTGLVIHLPAGTATAALYVVNLEAGWEAAKQAVWVREWRARKDLARPARLA